MQLNMALAREIGQFINDNKAYCIHLRKLLFIMIMDKKHWQQYLIHYLLVIQKLKEE